ncbi:PorV/PorQ family protein [Lewinella sp. JB7]|uniref:putative type IX sorting system protein PorV2 n=1 Tax=Lewinella sp. JB7 TaxID=2962887 RepID=UPI0020C9A706|nr:PorV/PorQ family protein [Lewinella sp. JB7]MCP9235313.1 PorV/PorQ family protein [Lewinella sp. JB7]
MTRSFRCLVFPTVLCLLSLPAIAQKYSNEFLSIGVGARAHGMGTAVVASQNDVYAAAWNPAGLAALPAERGLEIGAMHAEWFGGVGNYDYLGVTMPLSSNNQRIGVSLIRFGIDQIPNTLSLYEADGTINFDNVTEFSAADYAFLGSYARAFIRGAGVLRVGGNVKVIHRNIGTFASSWGFGLDLGAQYQRNRWTVALLARDVTTTFNAWSFSFTDAERDVLELTDNAVPINSVETTNPTFELGVARAFDITEQIGLTAEVDLIATTDGKRNTLLSADPISLDPAVGLEADYGDFVFLRAGVSQLQRIRDFDNQEALNSRPSLGLGLKVGQLFVDYAYTDLGDNEGRSTYSHIVSLRLGISPKQ